ncbi:MAG: TonB-dependent receptor plug domain-containing protein [Bacteroidetes bacterium]|nr:TonB-dependent receptor plug domain-containing protein [Bacteroidota bacterium]
MRKLNYLWMFLFCFNSATAGSEKVVEDSVPFYFMSLEQLMNVSVSVVSDLPMNGRESPGIVTVVTADEILESGAKDLMQVLQFIPGFDFGVDVEGVVGIGVRGNWGHEGKVLMLWDGLEMNEELYSTLQFGGHYPVSQIKRIEIIRGPGSAMYGGNAEYAVINIVTINGDLDGVAVDAEYSFYKDATASQGISAAFGKKWTNSRFSFSTYQSKFIRSDRDYVDNYGNSYSMSNLSSMNSEQYRLDYSYGKFSIIAFHDNYKLLQRDGYDEVYSQAYRSRFINSAINAKVEYNVGKWKITPGVKIKFEHPWYYNSEITGDSFEPYDVTSNKNLAYVNYIIDPTKSINVIGGFQYYNLVAIDHLENSTFTDGSKTFKNYNYGGHIQAIAKTKFVNFTLGSRVAYNKYCGTSFVPRIGLTKIWDKFHVKALYSVGFRAPSIENINLNWGIKPEYTLVAEIEGGVKLGMNSYLTANLYNVTTKHPIIFYYDPMASTDNYINESRTGTRGIELDYKWKAKKWFATINYAFYTTAGQNALDEYSPLNGENVNLAFPAHKFNFIGSFSLGQHLSLNPSVSFYSKRYSIASDQTEIVTTHSEAVYANINLSKDNFFTEGLTAQFGVFNFLDEDVWYIQPYNSNHAPLPGGGREIQIRLNYSLPNKK